MYRQAIMNTYRLYKAEFLATLIAMVGTAMLSFSLVAAPVASAVTIGGPSDCDNNAIIHCGVHSTSELVQDYNNSAYVRGVYAEFGITRADIANLPSTNVVGHVTKDGNVYVDSKSQPVATNAVTGGQQDIPGSTRVNHQGAVFYKRTPSVSFQQNSLPAFVSMKNGQFQFAVIASCGNAVSAAPTVQPKPQHVAIAPAKAVSKPKPQKPQKPAPTPAPAPAPSVTQSQSQEVNVNNNNTNNNTNVNNNTQITEQKVVPQTTKTVTKTTKTAQPQPTAPATTVQPSTQNTAATLPNTGPTGVVGAFLIAVGIGTFAYHRLLVRRFAN